MNQEVLIKKWLDRNLTAQEQKAFEQLDDYKELLKLNTAIKSFKAPEYSAEDNYLDVKEKLTPKKKFTNNWVKPFLRIAAILVIGLPIFYYTYKPNTNIQTLVAKKTTLKLPDASSVNLNANSTLVYNSHNWNTKREVKLTGEAYFKVAKGQQFDVITKDGIVRVLGTQFNVKQRTNYFEVTCYEGLVGVIHNTKTTKLQPGNTFKLINGKIFNEKKNSTEPSWIKDESSFNSVPLSYVIREFENQYKVKITTEEVDSSRLFTGSFTHKNLDLALKSITLPLNLRYRQLGNSIILKKSE